ncbi:MAG: 50S ribosomal protein L15 [Holosporales bacterium]|jgi:large subunit ribosomal protein L15|nr:50S ribosomal protein L15 [Holosporales bacterium]
MADELKLNNIRDNNKARGKIKLLGRGIGSGLGKTSGRGGKGQTARSGVSINGFEGGQTPLHRRLPKRGFVNIHRQELYELDFFKISRLKKKGLLDDGAVIDRDFLINIGYMRAHISGVSLIANGKIDFPAKVAVTRASSKAKEMLAVAGGTLTLE